MRNAPRHPPNDENPQDTVDILRMYHVNRNGAYAADQHDRKKNVPENFAHPLKMDGAAAAQI